MLQVYIDFSPDLRAGISGEFALWNKFCPIIKQYNVSEENEVILDIQHLDSRDTLKKHGHLIYLSQPWKSQCSRYLSSFIYLIYCCCGRHSAHRGQKTTFYRQFYLPFGVLWRWHSGGQHGTASAITCWAPLAFITWKKCLTVVWLRPFFWNSLFSFFSVFFNLISGPWLTPFCRGMTVTEE